VPRIAQRLMDGETLLQCISERCRQESSNSKSCGDANRTIAIQRDWTISLRDALVVAVLSDPHDAADRFDTIGIAVIVDRRDHRRKERLRPAKAQYADALRKISLAYCSSWTSRSRAFTLFVTSVGTPMRLRLLIFAFFIHSCSVCGTQPIVCAIETTAAHLDGRSCS